MILKKNIFMQCLTHFCMSDIKSDVVQNINRFYTTGAVECLNLIG